MISGLQGRKDLEDSRISGYTRDARLVHIDLKVEQGQSISSDLKPGDLVKVLVRHAAPFHLLGQIVNKTEDQAKLP
jgi:tRNA-2-methylthio-N6-dimethylallyladenosine synthase